jgi:hypothetical protein
MRIRSLLLLAILCSCSWSGAAFATPVSLLDPAAVVASQGGVAVTLADIDGFANTIPARDRAQVFNSAKRIERALIGLLLQKKLAAEARAHGLDAAIEGAAPGSYEAERRLAAAEQRHFIANLDVPDMEQLARETYTADPGVYVLPSPLVVEQILVSSAERGEAEAKARAREAEAEARRNPGDFPQLVATWSDTPDDAGQGQDGRVDVAASGDPALMKAAMALSSPGDISPVVKLADGFAVLKLVEKGPQAVLPFEAVRPQLVESLKRKWIKDRSQQRIDEIRNQPIDANPDLVASLRTRYAASADAEGATSPAPGTGR